MPLLFYTYLCTPNEYYPIYYPISVNVDDA